MTRDRMSALFQAGLTGDHQYLPDQKTRVRWVVASALRKQAESEERPIAAKLRSAAGKVETGSPLTKKLVATIGNRQFDAAFEHFCELTAAKLIASDSTPESKAREVAQNLYEHFKKTGQMVQK